MMGFSRTRPTGPSKPAPKCRAAPGVDRGVPAARLVEEVYPVGEGEEDDRMRQLVKRSRNRDGCRPNRRGSDDQTGSVSTDGPQ